MSITNTRFTKKFLSIYQKFASRGRYVIFIDVLSLMLAVYFGYALRLSFFIEQGYAKELAPTVVAFSICIIPSLIIGGTYGIFWPNASIEEYSKLFRWYCFGVALFLAFLKFTNFIRVPRSSLSILLLCGIVFLSLSRALWKLAYVTRNANSKAEKRTIIIGAGVAGTLVARDIIRNKSELLPIGFVDDNKELVGMSVASLKVLGTSSELRQICIMQDIQVALIAMPSATGEQIQKIMEPLEGLNIIVRTLPSLIDLADGQVTATRFRDVKLEDLLRREPVKLDNQDTFRLISGKTVLVTGAGGSIGSELCRQILAHSPKNLIVLGHGEHSIYLLLESLKEAGNKIPVQSVIADVADPIAIRDVFEQYHPQLVFHAGAHKHVPLMEENPREALRVNAYGTWNLALLAGEYGVERMVMVSTDKAVHPTSIMGATKRIAERLLLSAQQKHPKTRYMAVRFGNVLGSRGSVIPKFIKQIEQGGPVTVTHKEMKRYFMLIPEAVNLVLQAGVIGNGGELFVLDMGKPVKISEMAKTLIKLHGYVPNKDIKIEYTGIRPGEKLYEELFYDLAHVNKTAHDKIFLARMSKEHEDILESVMNLLSMTDISTEQLKKEILSLGVGTEIEDKPSLA